MSAALAPSLASSLERLAQRLQELDMALSDPVVAADNKRYRDLSREHAEVSSVCDLARRHTQRQQDLDTAREMLADAENDRFERRRLRRHRISRKGTRSAPSVYTAETFRSLSRQGSKGS